MEDLTIAHPQAGITAAVPQSNEICFFAGASEAVLRITPEGLFYKGGYVEDAGAAHKAVMETMKAMGMV